MTSMSRRPDSTIARKTRRPMRPKPLIATRKAIPNTSSMAGQRACEAGEARPGQPFFLLQQLLRRRHRRIGGNAELGIDVLVGTAGAKGVHSDKGAGRAKQLRTDVTVPALAGGGLDGDFH